MGISDMDGGDDTEDLTTCSLLLYSPVVIQPMAFLPTRDITLNIPVKGAEWIKYIGGGSITAWVWYEGIQSMRLLSMELVGCKLCAEWITHLYNYLLAVFASFTVQNKHLKNKHFKFFSSPSSDRIPCCLLHLIKCNW
jgi:hypothetical protein